MTFEAFLVELQQFSTRYTTTRLGFTNLWFVMTGVIVLIVISRFTEASFEGWWIVMGIVFACALGITIRRRWRASRAAAKFQCQYCQRGASETQLQTVSTTNRCPHCKQPMFRLHSRGRFVNDIPASEIQQAKSVEAIEPNNPYAPPGVTKPKNKSANEQQESVGCFVGLMRAIAGYFQQTIDSAWRVAASDQTLIENANFDLEEVGLERLDENAAKRLVANHRRVSWLWLIFGFCIPNMLAGFVIADEARRLYPDVETFCFESPWLLVGLAFSWLWGYLTVAVIHVMAPEAYHRWLNGGGNPMRTKRSQSTGVYGFFWTTHAENENRFRQYTLAIRYRCDSTGNVEFGLLNRKEFREYRLTRELVGDGQWRDLAVCFAAPLAEDNSEFVGDVIRVLPPDNMMIEVESMMFYYPPVETDATVIELS